MGHPKESDVGLTILAECLSAFVSHPGCLPLRFGQGQFGLLACSGFGVTCRVGDRSLLGLGFLGLAGVRLRPRRPHRLPGADGYARHEQQGDRRRRGQPGPVLPRELAQPVARAGRRRQHRLAGQVAVHVRREAVGRLVPAGAVLLEGLHHDPVQLAADQLRQPGRFDLPACG